MAIYWQTAERQLISLLDLYEAEDIAEAETIYKQTDALTSDNIADEAFPISKIRDALVEAYVQIGRLLCLTEGHPRRSVFRQTSTVAHGGVLPSCIGPYGSFTSGTRILRELSTDDIDAVKSDPDSSQGVELPYFAKDGNVLYSLLTPVTVEYFTVTRPVDHPSQLATLFDQSADVCLLPEEYLPALVNLAAGMLASTSAGLVGDAAGYFGVAEKLLRDMQVNIVTTDYKEHRGN